MYASLSLTPTSLTSNMPLPITRSWSSQQQIMDVVGPGHRPATRTACTFCQRRKQRCVLPVKNPQSLTCSKCLEGGIECVQEPGPTGASFLITHSVLLMP